MKPNIVIVVIDALRADKVGTMGGQDLTPNIDSLAAESSVFTNAFSTTNTTDGAITSIHTGKYPLSHGIVHHGDRVTNEEKQVVEGTTPLPEVLSNIGYETAKFGRPLGRWHRKGFDRYPSSTEDSAARNLTSLNLKTKLDVALNNIHPKLNRLVSELYQGGVRPLERRLTSAESYGEADYYGNSNDPVVESFRQYVGQSKPFYAFVHLMDTHAPYTADPELVCQYLNEFEYTPDSIDENSDSVPDHFHNLVADGLYPDIREKYYSPNGRPTSAVIDAHYDATVTEADRRLGAIKDMLANEGLDDETLLVVLSDHGESLTEHGIYYDHHGLYDVSTHVPLIISPPTGDPGRHDDLVQITDIAPTVLDFLGENDQLSADGASLRPLIEEDDTFDRTAVIAEEAHTQRRRMIRTKEQKLIYLLDGDTICRYCGVQHASAEELYDLSPDSYEKKNLSRKRPDDAAELRSRAEDIANQYSKNRTDSSSKNIEYDDEEEIHSRLQALGYR